MHCTEIYYIYFLFYAKPLWLLIFSTCIDNDNKPVTTRLNFDLDMSTFLKKVCLSILKRKEKSKYTFSENQSMKKNIL